MTDGFSNNATPKYLGYVYQVLIAIEKCFEAQPNETIWIECFGDVYDGHTFTEVKHHFGHHNLTSNSKDFWNTLKNLVVEDSLQFEKMVLHTTSTILDNSIFHDWNELCGEERFEKIKSYEPCDTTKSNYEKIFKEASNKEIKSILSKFTIEYSRLPIDQQWKCLIDKRKLRCLSEQYREDVLHWIYSYINKRAIDNRKFWKININDFDDAFQFQVNRYGGNKIPFPKHDIQYKPDNFNTFIFLDEYKNIGIRGADRGTALNEYFQTKNSEEKLVDFKPDIMPEVIKQYSDDVISKAKGYKSQLSYDIELEDIGTSVSSKASRA
ncbi:hypothetical protein [Photobacterium profundum]|uniref:Uncharacterized protein n=1 Tax=Photobacterium profundum (strain SS9) TaxID=298386 RepID=Q6LRT6_PHOPR|nr:hypothetical protein [Photobacterium profundum]CAG19990.1 conserved hypothetical protein [Photobacterium profundum SS9]